jgi:hypothetical protein
MTALPWGDWQFWAVTLLAVGALALFLRPYFSRRRIPRCSNCEACAPERRNGTGGN